MKQKELEATPTQMLELYDRLLSATANDLTHFREQLEYGMKNNMIGQSYYVQKQKTLGEALIKINKHLDNIEKEMRTRLKKKFPDVITFKQLEVLGKSLTEEAERHKNLLEEQKTDEKKVVDFTVSKTRRK